MLHVHRADPEDIERARRQLDAILRRVRELLQLPVYPF
jgi:hypothetical protein